MVGCCSVSLTALFSIVLLIFGGEIAASLYDFAAVEEMFVPVDILDTELMLETADVIETVSDLFLLLLSGVGLVLGLVVFTDA